MTRGIRSAIPFRRIRHCAMSPDRASAALARNAMRALTRRRAKAHAGQTAGPDIQ
jgi:hypothetical protein